MGRLKIHNSLFTDYCIERRKHTAFTSRDCTTNAILKFHNRSVVVKLNNIKKKIQRTDKERACFEHTHDARDT